MLIGVFTKNKDKDRFGGYHCSPCKIYKVLDEMFNLYGIRYEVNNYSNKYKFSIVDRVKPTISIQSKYILNISETCKRYSWSTHNAFVSPSVKKIGDNEFYLLNYCHGKKISAEDLCLKRSGGVYIGRYSKLAEFKVSILAKKGLVKDVYPIKYWKGKSILRFHKEADDYLANLDYLQSRNEKVRVMRPLNHSELYSGLNKRAYSFGFVPSIYPLSSKLIQAESSSKFFEYIGCGIPVLIEGNVPEAKIVLRNPFLGEVYYGESEMLKKAHKLNSVTYDYCKILKYSQSKHYPDSRAKTIYKKFITEGG